LLAVYVTLLVFLLSMLHHLSSTLFPYTTLFRSPGGPHPHLRTSEAAMSGRKTHRIPKPVPPQDLPEVARVWGCGGSCVRSWRPRSEEHTSELQSLTNIVCRLLLVKKKNTQVIYI